MKRIAIVLLIVGFSQFATAASSKVKTTATVLSQVPTTTTYDWSLTGAIYTSCSYSNCFSSIQPAENGTRTVDGAELYLRLPDQNIIIASCNKKAAMGINIALFALEVVNTSMYGGSQIASTVYRGCRVPSTDTIVDAVIDEDKAAIKLSWEKNSEGGYGMSETYFIAGHLLPAAYAALMAAPPLVDLPHDFKMKDQLIANIKESRGSQAYASALLSEGHVPTQEELKQRVKDGKASMCAVLTTPPGAEIWIDNNLAGKTPMVFALIQRDHPRVLTIVMDGYNTVEQSFLPDGKDIPFVVTLVKVTPSL